LCLLAEHPLLAADPSSALSEALSWIDSPYRSFRAPQALLAGSVLLFDEGDQRQLGALMAPELARLYADLYRRDGFRFPFADGEPLRIYVARREAEGIRRVAARRVEAGRLIGPALLLDATGMGDAEIVREAARQVAVATLQGYGAPDPSFLTAAAAEFLSLGPVLTEEVESIRESAAAPTLELARHPATLGRLWLEELTRLGGGPALLRQAWERAAESGEQVLPTLLRSLVEASGEGETAALLRFAARLYASVEPEPSPSRVSLFDLEAGALDAAWPASFTLRHRTFLPAEHAPALRVTWPEDGAPAAAVVRYRDAAIPPDVLFLAAGDLRTIPLSGVSRVDWVVAGGGAGSSLAAPASFQTAPGPFAGLSARATAGSEGPRVFWTTASHDRLVGWAIFREEVLQDGTIARSGPEILPAADTGEESFRYAYLDALARPGTFYRYTVWAVTEDGLLARAFAATLRTAD
jgi:hypothetical protein